MKRLIPIFFLLIWAQSARAQNFTTVTASNIQDVSGAKLASGMLCFDATNATGPSNDTPSNEISFQAGGGGQVIRGPICTPVTNGAIGTFQVPNSANTIPAGVAYHVYVVRGFYHVLDYYGVQVTGSTWSFDNYNPNSPTPAPPTGASVNGPLTVNGNLSVTGSLSLSPQTSLTLGTITVGSNPNFWIGQDGGVGAIRLRTNVGSKDTWFLTIPDLSQAAPQVLMFGGANIGANPNLTINGSLQITTPGSITVGSNPNFWIGQDGGVGAIRLRTNVGSKDTWFLTIPDLSQAAPQVLMFGGANIGANPILTINGSLQLTTPLAVAYGGTGTSSPALAAGSNISISGTWPNQTIATVASPLFSLVKAASVNPTCIGPGDKYIFSSGDTSGYTTIGYSTSISVSGVTSSSLYVANTCGNAHVAVDNSGNVGIQGSLQLGTPLAVQYGGTGTSNPSLIAGTGISITGTWPNQTISATGGGGGANSIQTSASDTTWAGIASTTLVSTSQNTGGVWTIHVFAEVSAAGTTCTTGDGTTTMSLTINYTDPYTNGTVTLNSVVSLNLGSGNGTVGTFSTGTVITYPKSGTAITYSTSVTKNNTCSTPPQYTVALQAIH